MKKILITTAIILFTVSSLVAFLHTVKTNKNSVNLMLGNVEALAANEIQYYHYPVTGNCAFSGRVSEMGRLYRGDGKYIATGLPVDVYCTLIYYDVIPACVERTTPTSNICIGGNCEDFWRRIAK